MRVFLWASYFYSHYIQPVVTLEFTSGINC
jgi:hypothetical protein